MLHVFCNLEESHDGLPPMCDMTFEIVAKDYDEAESLWRLAFRADAAPYEPVGFGATIPVSGWRKQVSGEGDDSFHSFWGSVILHSQGHESDRLLAFIAEYYEVPAPSAAKRGLLSRTLGREDIGRAATWKFTDSIECLAVGIASDPAVVANEAIRMKLFFDDGVENGRYAELFLTIDMPEGIATLNEKDEDYRSDVVHWLSSPGNVTANPYTSQG